MENGDGGKQEGVNISTVDVHVFDFELEGFLNNFMSSGFIQKGGAIVSLVLAMAFGVMLLIGGGGLLKSDASKTAADTVAVEASSDEPSESLSNDESVEE